MSINIDDQLTYLEETKEQIRQALIRKGSSISDQDTFRSYVTKINQIILTDTIFDRVDIVTINDIGNNNLELSTTDFINIWNINIEDIEKDDIVAVKVQNISEHKQGIKLFRFNKIENDIVYLDLEYNWLSYYENSMDATATPEDIISNKTAYSGGEKITGIFSLDTELNTQANLLNIQTTNLASINSLLNNIYSSDVNVVTADGNITNNDVLAGKIGYANGQRIVGSLPSTGFDVPDGLKLGTSIIQNLDLTTWNTSNTTNLSYMFSNCKNLTSLNIDNWDISNVKNLSYIFSYCDNLRSLNISNWNTSNVINMQRMFVSCNKLTSINVSNWNTSSVENIYQVFAYCPNLTSLNINNWNTSKITDMSRMLESSGYINLNFSNWNTSNLISTSYMFLYCNNLTNIDISNWNVSKVTSIHSMFEGCSNLININISNWDSSNINDLQYTFQKCNNLSNESINSIIDMCLNISNLSGKTLKTNIPASPFYDTNITNIKYQNRWAELNAKGWDY